MYIRAELGSGVVMGRFVGRGKKGFVKWTIVLAFSSVQVVTVTAVGMVGSLS